MVEEARKREPKEEPRGITCPGCGCSELRVLYTRYRPKRIVRVRQCQKCKRRVITNEFVGPWRVTGGGDDRDQKRGLASAFDGTDSGA